MIFGTSPNLGKLYVNVNHFLSKLRIWTYDLSNYHWLAQIYNQRLRFHCEGSPKNMQTAWWSGHVEPSWLVVRSWRFNNQIVEKLAGKLPVHLRPCSSYGSLYCMSLVGTADEGVSGVRELVSATHVARQRWKHAQQRLAIGAVEERENLGERK